MANSLAKAIRYIKEPAELERTLKQGLYTADLVNNTAIFTTTNTVKYQHIEFGSSALGDYDTTNGYTQTDIVTTWKDLVLTQDKGNSLKYDKFEDEEAMANGIVMFTNRYILKVQSKALDIYRFGVITGKSGIIHRTETLTSTNVLDEVLRAFALMKDNDIDTSGLILYMNPAIEHVLGKAVIGKGYITVGNWNGNIDTEVKMFNTAKMVTVPSDRLGEGIQFILLHKDACPCFEKYRETEYFEKIPGHGGRRSQADIGVYHDAFVYDELVNAVYVSKVATHTIAFDDNNQTATGTMSSLTVNEGSSVKLPVNTLTVDGYVFKGWDTTAYDAGTHDTPVVVYEDGAVVTMEDADITLYAVWEAE